MWKNVLLCSICTIVNHRCNTVISIKFDVNVHRPRRSRRNEKNKLLSGVEPRSQTSTPDTKPRSPDKSLSSHFLFCPVPDIDLLVF